MPKLRFLADANLKPAIIRGVRRANPLIDFTDARALPPGLPDPEVLRLAAGTGRALVTHDIRTMPAHLAEFIRTAVSPGVVLIQQVSDIGPAVQDLLLLWDLLEPAELENKICRLPGLGIFQP